ncbi:lantibiotic dehydratase [Nonomuraea sp. SYSU D8015]|uniref:lantibiotic dehydratase n=1 Tax=Nonomuraea sp. SYSU D8015 TaxID=2593644 RepID=UPI001660160F|nr:lantibiotic dehydratase [Nonomuraea sp. SYSU D8015]
MTHPTPGPIDSDRPAPADGAGSSVPAGPADALGSVPAGTVDGGGSSVPAGPGGLSWRVPAGGEDLVVEVHPWALVCATGFPARLIGDLGRPALRHLTERMLAAGHRLSTERRHFQQRAAALRDTVLRLPPEQQEHARSCIQSVRAGAPLTGAEIGLLASLGLGDWVRRWQSAVVAAASARAAAWSAHAAARLATRCRVAEAYDDESVRHATSAADPAFLQAIAKHPLARRPGAGTARRSRLLTATAHRHLRRLATVIEPTALPGPTLYVRLDPATPEPLHVEPAPPARSPDRPATQPSRHDSAPASDAGSCGCARVGGAGACDCDPVTGDGAGSSTRVPITVGHAASSTGEGDAIGGGLVPPACERVTIGGAALVRLRDALSSIMPLCYLAALLAREDAAEAAACPQAPPTRMRDLAAILGRLVSHAHRRQQDAHRHGPDTGRPDPGGDRHARGAPPGEPQPVQDGPDVVRLRAQDVAAAVAGLWARAGERFDRCLPAPRLMAVGPDLASATWLLSDLRDDRDTVDVTPPAQHTVPVVAPRVDLGPHTPRIMIDDLVFQRARWRLSLPAARGADAFDRWTAIHRLRAGHGLPRHVFVHHLAEPEPFHVDLCDPLAVEDLARRDPAEVLVTEMLPAPGQLWWRVAGDERCAELRLACLLRRAAGR